MKSRIVALAAVFAVLLIPAAHGTTIPDVFVTVHVTITDSRISLSRHAAGRGDEVRFAMRNAGTTTHNFTLGNEKRQQGSQTGFSTTLKPKQQKLVLLYMDYRGPLPYRSVIKADLSKPGMKGIFRIR
jgi:uncharacterized cupredoxin-like copper-binding protein